MSKYEVIFGPYFPVFGLFVFIPNKGKYGPEITQYLDTFHAVINEDFPKVMEKLATLVIQQRFSPNAARGKWVESALKVMSKFVLAQVAEP